MGRQKSKGLFKNDVIDFQSGEFVTIALKNRSLIILSLNNPIENESTVVKSTSLDFDKTIQNNFKISGEFQFIGRFLLTAYKW